MNIRKYLPNLKTPKGMRRFIRIMMVFFAADIVIQILAKRWQNIIPCVGTILWANLIISYTRTAELRDKIIAQQKMLINRRDAENKQLKEILEDYVK